MLPFMLYFFLHFMAGQPKESKLKFQVRSDIDMKVTDRQLHQARNLKDLNAGFPSSWIQKYVETEIWIPETGVRIKGKDDQLDAEQRKPLSNVPLFGKIHVAVQYQQENPQSKKWDNRGIYFTLTHVPEKLAEYANGEKALDAFWNSDRLKEWESTYPNLKKASISFLVNEKGKIQSIQCQQSSGNLQADQWMINEIKKMADWIPAKTKDGQPVTQKLRLVLEEGGC